MPIHDWTRVEIIRPQQRTTSREATTMLLAQPVIFESRIPFAAKRIGAAALYCSDGRFGEAMDEFLHEGLELPRYDRLAVPGGAGCLAGHFASWREDEGVGLQLRFLVES